MLHHALADLSFRVSEYREEAVKTDGNKQTYVVRKFAISVRFLITSAREYKREEEAIKTDGNKQTYVVRKFAISVRFLITSDREYKREEVGYR